MFLNDVIQCTEGSTGLRGRASPIELPRFLIFSLWAVLFAAAQASAQTVPAQTSIRGIVINSVSREPIGHALVFSDDNRFGAMTDDQGRFEFTLPQPASTEADSPPAGAASTPGPPPSSPPGPYTIGSLTARKPGFLQDQRSSVNVWSQSNKDLIIMLTPEAFIIGRVTLPAGEFSGRMEVELYRREVQSGRGHWSSAATVATKANGEFRFAELPAGSYKLFTHEMMDNDPVASDPRGQRFGYPPIYYPGATDFASAGTITLSPGKTVETTLSPARVPYYPVKIAVSGAPLGLSLQVNVSLHGHRSPGYSLGSDGEAITGTLPDGTYTVEAFSFGQANYDGILNITIHGAPLSGPVMPMVANGSVTVKIRDERKPQQSGGIAGDRMVSAGSGRRVFVRGDVEVGLEPAAELVENIPHMQGIEWTQKDVLVLQNVSPGSYWARAYASPGFALSLTAGDVDLLHHPLVVPSGGSSLSLELTLRDDGADVEGIVQGIGQDPVAGGGAADLAASPPVPANDSRFFVYFIPLPDSTGQFREVAVQSSGRFETSQLPPGAYRVLAFDGQQSQLEYENPEAMRAYDAQGIIVRLVPGQKEHLQLQLAVPSE